MSENPYQAPTVAVADVDELQGELPLAGQGRRFLNYVIDVIVCSIMLRFVATALFSAGVLHSENAGLGVMVLNYAGYFVYFLIFEGLWQRTPAKLATRTRVVSVDGEIPTRGQIAKRSLIRLIPFEPFSFLFRKQAVGWHDKWSETRVVLVDPK
jgi:uncharacterized RDD family membrane protein YckC